MFQWMLFAVCAFQISSMGDMLSTEEGDIDKYSDMSNSFKLLIEDLRKKDDKIESLENFIQESNSNKIATIEFIDAKSVKAINRQIQQIFEHYNLSLQTQMYEMEKQIDKNKQLLKNHTLEINRFGESKEITPPCGDNAYNLALGKPAKESSTYEPGPHAATDGRKDSNFHKGSCTHTTSQKKPWWQVDLMKQFPISRVVITNRGDCCGERLHNLLVTIGNETSGAMEVCGWFKGRSTSGAVETILCDHTVYGQFVKIQIQSDDPIALTLCEVEIFSR